MSEYVVEVSEAALKAIAEHARYIAVDDNSPVNAQRWLERVWDAVDSLEQVPRRAATAEEDAYVEFEVRQLVVGMHLLLFTIDDAHKRVWIVGLRHGHRRPHPEELSTEHDQQ